MVKNKSFRGLEDISGNNIFLENTATKIFLDFKPPFTFGSEFFTSSFRPRRLSGLDDNYEFNPPPKITNLDSKKILVSIILAYTEPTVQASFLFHILGDFFNEKEKSVKPNTAERISEYVSAENTTDNGIKHV